MTDIKEYLLKHLKPVDDVFFDMRSLFVDMDEIECVFSYEEGSWYDRWMAATYFVRPFARYVNLGFRWSSACEDEAEGDREMVKKMINEYLRREIHNSDQFDALCELARYVPCNSDFDFMPPGYKEAVLDVLRRHGGQYHQFVALRELRAKEREEQREERARRQEAEAAEAKKALRARQDAEYEERTRTSLDGMRVLADGFFRRYADDDPLFLEQLPEKLSLLKDYERTLTSDQLREFEDVVRKYIR